MQCNECNECNAMQAGRAKPMVYEALVKAYFRSPHLITQMKTYLEKPILKLLEDTDKALVRGQGR